jgi:hypothetical protein
MYQAECCGEADGAQRVAETSLIPSNLVACPPLSGTAHAAVAEVDPVFPSGDHLGQ